MGTCAHVVLNAVSMVSLAAMLLLQPTAAGADTPPANKVQVPVYFEPNAGQFGTPAAAAARTAHFTALFHPGSVRLVPKNTSAAATLAFAGAAARQPRLVEPLGSRVHYLRGRQTEWRTDVPTFARLLYEDVYAGIDVVFYAAHGTLEYDFIVAPHANPRPIAIALGGAAASLNENGDITLQLGEGTLIHHRPVAYQVIDGARRAVDARYRVAGDGTIRVELGKYDRRHELVIDPVLSYSSPFFDAVIDLALDADGNAYVTGWANDASFPTTPGAFDRTFSGTGPEGFVAKIAADGQSLVWATYIGGTRTDRPGGIAVDASGNVYVVGDTLSPDFPTTAGAWDTTCGTDGTCTTTDGFVVKLNPTGSALLYSTFLGGNSSEDPLAIAVESSGHAVVVGLTRSEDFPVTPGAFQQTRVGTALHDDGFVVRLTPTGSSAAYSTLLGGSGDDVLFAVRVDAAGNAVIAGDTESANLPIVAGQKPNIDGERDAIVAKFGPTGTAQFVTYLGGSGLESGWAIDVDAAGNIYVAGDTLLGGFPGTRPPIGATGGRDIFVAKLPASGTSITWSVRIGGSGEEIIRDAELDAGNRLHLVGGTSSRDFPVTPDAVQRDTAQGGGLIYAALNATGTALTYGTLLGAESSGFGTAVAIHGDDTWIAGSASPGFPEVNAPGTFGGSSPSGFLARFDWDPPPAVSDPRELVLYAADAENIRGAWRLEPNGGAAGGAHIHQPNAGVPKINSPASDPAHSFELTFTPVAGVAYRLWIRGRADNNSYENDSVWIQFSGSVDASGNAIWRTGTTSATWAGVENCAGCGLSGWGWSDNGYGGFGPVVRFATSEEQTLRVQAREDGISIDQIVLSAARFMTDAPGAPKNDSTILPPSDGTEDEPPSECDPLEIVLHTDAATLAGAWRREADATAASGTKVRHPNARAPKIAAPLANPTNYVELTFHAEANRDYRLWIRGRADGNSYENDSVYVQFSDSVTAAGAPTWRTGSTSATTYVLEDCGGCHSVGWGWNDNHYGSDRLGTPVRFAATGTHTIRIQTREDGLSIDQIVLSAATYFSAGPGPAIDDATILDTCGE